MDSAHLVVTAPGGTAVRHELRGNVVTIGRAAPGHEPDVVLDDPGSLISRRHCQLLAAHGSWWVEDCGSRNGTFLEVDGELVRVHERIRLTDGDVVSVVAESGEDRRLWTLTLVDPSATVTIHPSEAPATSAPQEPEAPAGPCVRWTAATFELVVVADGAEQPIELRKQGYQLIGYMADRNADAAAPAVCTVEEILEGVWGDPVDWDRYRPPTAQNVRDLVAAVRREIEPDPANPRILENLRGVGYRLNTC